MRSPPTLPSPPPKKIGTCTKAIVFYVSIKFHFYCFVDSVVFFTSNVKSDWCIAWGLCIQYEAIVILGAILIASFFLLIHWLYITAEPA